jgi:hypothetical protein
VPSSSSAKTSRQSGHASVEQTIDPPASIGSTELPESELPESEPPESERADRASIAASDPAGAPPQPNVR